MARAHANRHLPQEILSEIFSRLPAKSIGQARLLSKSWRKHLSSPQFIRLHLSHKPHRQQNVLLLTQYQVFHTTTTPVDGKPDSLVSLESVFRLTYGQLQVVGSCNGLVLLEIHVYGGNELILVNPITGQRVQIPTPTLRGLNRSSTAYGLGYDTCSEDYKIVALQIGNGETLVDVYSVKNGFWKRANNYPYILFNPNSARLFVNWNGCFVNGAIHWLVYNEDGGDHAKEIAAFDVTNEVFRESHIPTGVRSSAQLYAVGGCLMMIVDNVARNARVGVCILKEYGLPESWTKFTVTTNGFHCRPLCFTGEEKLVFIVSERDLFLYNLSKGTRKKMVVDGGLASFLDGCTFEYSLGFPSQHGGDGLEAEG